MGNWAMCRVSKGYKRALDFTIMNGNFNSPVDKKNLRYTQE